MSHFYKDVDKLKIHNISVFTKHFTTKTALALGKDLFVNSSFQKCPYTIFLADFTETDLVNSEIEEFNTEFQGMCNNIPALSTGTNPC